MTDTEKKIAEIRDFYLHHPEDNINKRYVDFLISELDREREEECTQENPCKMCLRDSVEGYKNIVRELEEENRKLREDMYKLSKLAEERYRKLDAAQQEIERLREERDQYAAEADGYEREMMEALKDNERLRNLARKERELANHWMKKHHDDVVKLREERAKLIEGMKYAHRFAKRDDLYDKEYVEGILKEIGVNVE